jgi:hypothetical protein
MKVSILVFFLAMVLTSCTSTNNILYNWGDYEKASYEYLNKSDEKSAERLAKRYQEIINYQNNIRAVVPPGVYADYGFLLTQEGNTQLGKEMLRKEIALYPESEIFINRVLKIIEE